MALVLEDRVRDITTTTGTGTIALSGTAPNGYRSFASGIGNGNTTYYTIVNDTEYEVGLGTFTSSGNTLSRDTVFSSSNGGALVNFSAGTKDVFVTFPAKAALAAGNPSFQAIASGTLANGSTVVINADGTVSAVSGPTGSTEFATPDTYSISATYDANAQKVVIAYSDGSNSFFGTAIVGTVSGTSISFGTPVVFESANSNYITTAYDANAQKIVIAYSDGGSPNYGTAIVGTVSGTSISFGTAVVFESAATFYISATYDANAQKVVIAYRDDGNSGYGTAIVGTVSGTSISFGTAVVFESAATAYISATYDANAQKVVIAYSDGGNSGYGTAIVGTVSGTSISFGTAVVFGEYASDTSVTYDASTQKVVIAYSNTTGIGKAVVGTVSGTSISFGAELPLAGGPAYGFATTYDAANQKVILAYTKNVAPDAGAAEVFVATNLTAENFIGFSNAAYTNGQTATIQIVGAVDDAQSGLTAGQSYFVQLSGTIGLTPAAFNVFAGTAVSATKIIVKG